MRNKLIIIFLSLFLLISFMVGCGNRHAPQSSDNNQSLPTPDTKDLPLVGFVDKKVPTGKGDASNKYAGHSNLGENQKDQETASSTKEDQPSGIFSDKESGPKPEGSNGEIDKDKKAVDEDVPGLKSEDDHKPATQTEGEDPLKKEEDGTPEESKGSKSSKAKEFVKNPLKFLKKRNSSKETINTSGEEADKLKRVQSEVHISDKKQKGTQALDKANKIKRTQSESNVNQSEIKEDADMGRDTVDKSPENKKGALRKRVFEKAKGGNKKVREAEDIHELKKNKQDLQRVRNPRKFFLSFRKTNKEKTEGIHQEEKLENTAATESLGRAESSVSENKEDKDLEANMPEEASKILEIEAKKKSVLNKIKSRRTNSSFHALPVEKREVDEKEQKRSKDDTDIDALKKGKDKQTLKSFVSPRKIFPKFHKTDIETTETPQQEEILKAMTTSEDENYKAHVAENGDLENSETSILTVEALANDGENLEKSQQKEGMPETLKTEKRKSRILERVKNLRTTSSLRELPLEKEKLESSKLKKSKDDADIDELKKRKDKQPLKDLLSPRKLALKLCKRNIKEKIGEDEIYGEEPIENYEPMEKNSKIDEKYKAVEGEKLDKRKSKIEGIKLRKEKQKTDKNNKTHKEEKKKKKREEFSKNDAEKKSEGDPFVQDAMQVGDISIGAEEDGGKVKKKKKRARSKEDNSKLEAGKKAKKKKEDAQQAKKEWEESGIKKGKKQKKDHIKKAN